MAEIPLALWRIGHVMITCCHIVSNMLQLNSNYYTSVACLLVDHTCTNTYNNVTCTHPNTCTMCKRDGLVTNNMLRIYNTDGVLV